MPNLRDGALSRFRPRSGLVRRAQIELLLRHTRFQAVAAPFLGLFLVAAFAENDSGWLWLLGLALAYGARFISLGIVRQHEKKDIYWRLKAYLVGLALCGPLWSLAPFAIAPEAGSERLVVGIFVGIVVLVGIVGNFLYFASALVYTISWILPALVALAVVYTGAFPEFGWTYIGVVVTFALYAWKCLEVINLPIGETLELNEALARERDRAAESNKAKTDFLAMMSHELRTPLNAIIGYAEIIRDQVFGPKATDKYLEQAGYIRSAAGLLNDLINDLLDLSALQAGGRQLKINKLDIRDCIDTAVHFLNEDADKKHIHVSRQRLSDNCSALVLADKQAAVQCVSNLLSNAIKYSGEGDEIHIRQYPSDSGLTIEIEDTGLGIPADELPRIMEPFRRGDAATAGALQGVGLGLSIARDLMLKQGGCLDLVSEKGKGTRVMLTFAV